MSEYRFTCHECSKTTSESTTGKYDFGDEVECPWCGRVHTVRDLEIRLFLNPTSRKVSPTKLEQLEQLKITKENK